MTKPLTLAQRAQLAIDRGSIDAATYNLIVDAGGRPAEVLQDAVGNGHVTFPPRSRR